MKITMKIPSWSRDETVDEKKRRIEHQYFFDGDDEPVELDIPDALHDKTIAIIDELLGRTYSEWEEHAESEG